MVQAKDDDGGTGPGLEQQRWKRRKVGGFRTDLGSVNRIY